MDIRNIAIIAHVDHGKTTLVDGMLKQTNTFRENQDEMNRTTILDSGDLEREKGITILAKNTAIQYKDTKINVIDTPGHADFSGEVERVINMADGALLVVDAAEGPLAQTQFVLETALKHNLKLIVVINKIDRKDARVEEVLKDTEELILKMAHHESHLDFRVLYAVGRDGKAWCTLPDDYSGKADLTPLFEEILNFIPPPQADPDKPFKMLISTLDFDSYKGTYAIGKVTQGNITAGQEIVLLNHTEKLGNFRIQQIFTSNGLKRVETLKGEAGDIIALTGIPDAAIGQTVADVSDPTGYPVMIIGDPTIKIFLSANTSPLSGREGKYVTARQLEARLTKEKKTNIGLKITSGVNGGFEVAGRGELHIAILLETLRREGYEMQVGRPQVIFRENGQKELEEPFEDVMIEVSKEQVGIVVEEIGKRKGQITDVVGTEKGTTRYFFTISSRNLLGFRSLLLSRTSGNSLFTAKFAGYRKAGEYVPRARGGAIIAFESGVSRAYALETVQNRGIPFIGPGEDVYEGMIVGVNNREEDIEINVCKFKKLTNMHTENSDVAVKLDPPTRLTLEQSIDFLQDDELLEITPKSLRLRKILLKKIDRVRSRRNND